MLFLSRAFLVVLALMGLGLTVGGGWLVGLGGSWYYVALGIGWLAAAVLMWRGSAAGATIAIASAILSAAWAI
jgi:glucose dehydrogenase